MRSDGTRPPEGGHGKTLAGGSFDPNINPFSLAAAKALKRELWIVVQAANIVAGGRDLSCADAERVHAAHQHIIRVLAAAAGREVLT